VRSLLTLLTLSLAAAALAAPATALAADPGRSVTVSGSGSVSVVPDRADVGFGVTTRAATAAAALAADAKAMTKLIAALKAAGIAPADIQTQLVSLSPQISPNGRVVAYEASNSVQARIRGIDRVGPIIDAAVAAGANTIDGPSLARSDADALYRRALAAAVSHARVKAAALAKAAKVKLGRVLRIVEGSSASPVPLAGESAKAAAPATPIEPGTTRIEASVTVTYALA